MPRTSESWAFVLTLMAAAATLVSIAAAESLLALAFIAAIVARPRPMVWPSYSIPLAVFMATTVLSLLMSPQPGVGMSVVRKFVLFTMGLLAANFVITETRARAAMRVLVVVATAASLYAVAQFPVAYYRYLSTGKDDPTVAARITGFMGHWMTFSGEQLLIWCAAVPALMVLGRKWLLPLAVIGTGLVLSFTRSVWLGAIGGFFSIALLLPRRLAIAVVAPIALIGVAASGLIVHRVSMSFQEQRFAPDSGRVELFIGGVRMIKDHPWFGVGPERIRAEFPRYYRHSNLASANFFYGHLENNIVQIAAERGLLCLAAFLWVIFEIYAALIGMVKTAAAENRWPAISAIAALTGFLISGCFSYNFGDSELLLLLLFIVSVPYGLNRTAIPVENTCPSDLVAIPS